MTLAQNSNPLSLSLTQMETSLLAMGQLAFGEGFESKMKSSVCAVLLYAISLLGGSAFLPVTGLVITATFMVTNPGRVTRDVTLYPFFVGTVAMLGIFAVNESTPFFVFVLIAYTVGAMGIRLVGGGPAAFWMVAAIGVHCLVVFVDPAYTTLANLVGGAVSSAAMGLIAWQNGATAGAAPPRGKTAAKSQTQLTTLLPHDSDQNNATARRRK